MSTWSPRGGVVDQDDNLYDVYPNADYIVSLNKKYWDDDAGEWKAKDAAMDYSFLSRYAALTEIASGDHDQAFRVSMSTGNYDQEVMVGMTGSIAYIAIKLIDSLTGETLTPETFGQSYIEEAPIKYTEDSDYGTWPCYEDPNSQSPTFRINEPGDYWSHYNYFYIIRSVYNDTSHYYTPIINTTSTAGMGSLLEFHFNERGNTGLVAFNSETEYWYLYFDWTGKDWSGADPDDIENGTVYVGGYNILFDAFGTDYLDTAYSTSNRWYEDTYYYGDTFYGGVNDDPNDSIVYAYDFVSSMKIPIWQETNNGITGVNNFGEVNQGDTGEMSVSWDVISGIGYRVRIEPDYDKSEMTIYGKRYTDAEWENMKDNLGEDCSFSYYKLSYDGFQYFANLTKSCPDVSDEEYVTNTHANVIVTIDGDEVNNVECVGDQSDTFFTNSKEYNKGAGVNQHEAVFTVDYLSGGDVSGSTTMYINIRIDDASPSSRYLWADGEEENFNGHLIYFIQGDFSPIEGVSFP